ncbi:hypothetical protein SNEBB_008011 [Seison nebaliae]|nr:hypothetical protein SNEBB_008011 [Seison nebaliae]
MENELSRIDCFQSNGINKNCMKIFKGKKDEKICYADKDGLISFYQLNTGTLQKSWEVNIGESVECIRLIRKNGESLMDRFFVLTQKNICGFSKKGKTFFQLSLPSTIQEVKDFIIVDAFIHVLSQTTYYLYEGAESINKLSISSGANALIDLSPSHILVVTDSRSIVLIENGELLDEIDFQSGTIVKLVKCKSFRNNPNDLIFVTNEGIFGFCTFHLNEKICQIHWTIENDRNNFNSSITSLVVFDITGDGIDDIIVGRSNGNVHVFCFPSDDTTSQPLQQYNYIGNESVGSLDCGRIRNNNLDEIIVTTQQGWTFSLTIRDESVTNSFGSNLERINQLQRDVENLEVELKHKKSIYYSQCKKENAMAALPSFRITSTMELKESTASYVLEIECEHTIDLILLQSDVPIDVLNRDTNAAVISFSDLSDSEENHLLATYRCQMNTNRIEITIRTVEGQIGDLTCYVTPKIVPKVCRTVAWKILPLSLHAPRSNVDRSSLELKELHSLTFEGQFSIQQPHSWLLLILPKLTTNTPQNSTQLVHYINTFLQTHLYIQFNENKLEFFSDNISTITILKDAVSRQATLASVKLKINFHISQIALEKTLEKVHPLLQHQKDLLRKKQMIEPIREIIQHERIERPEVKAEECLSKQFLHLYQHSDEVEEEAERSPSHLQRLFGMITDLYIDQHKMHGTNVKSRINELNSILENYSFDQLLSFFLSTST